MDNMQQDNMLWQLARKRAAFKWNFAAYVIVNPFLIGVWYFSSGPGSYFWPVWPILGWGIGMAFSYAAAYHSLQFNAVQKEYDKLKKEQESYRV